MSKNKIIKSLLNIKGPTYLTVLWLISFTLLLYFLFPGVHLNYDAAYSLYWGGELFDGRMPDFNGLYDPTPHPLAIFISALASPLGNAAPIVLTLLSMSSLAVLAYFIFRSGALLYCAAVGLTAAVLIASRDILILEAADAMVDIPFLALVFAAVYVEARKPRSGLPVLVLLAIAGLLRPEAWLLSAVYFIYIAAIKREPGTWKLAFVAASGPCLWVVSDLVFTGNPFHSLTHTQKLAEEVDRARGVATLPLALGPGLARFLGTPAFIGGQVGCVLAVGLYGRRSILPIALLIVGFFFYGIIAITGLPLLTRYLLLPASALAIFCGFAAFGWLEQARGTLRTVWAFAGAALIVAIFFSAPTQYKNIENARESSSYTRVNQADLKLITDRIMKSNKLSRCYPLFLTGERPFPLVAHWLGEKAELIRNESSIKADRGMVLAPASVLAVKWSFLDPVDAAGYVPGIPRSFKADAGNKSWQLYADCPVKSH